MKNILRITAGSLILASAGTFVATSQPATGWSTIGGSLGLNQRDFRLYDNFSASRSATCTKVSNTLAMSNKIPEEVIASPESSIVSSPRTRRARPKGRS